jgi:hypothetical protein
MNRGRERNTASTFLSSDPVRGQLRLLLPSWPVRRARIQQLGDELGAGRALNETNEEEDGGDSESVCELKIVMPQAANIGDRPLPMPSPPRKVDHGKEQSSEPLCRQSKERYQ